MESNARIESSLEIEERAADWLALKDSGKWTPADESALNEWLESSTTHWVAYVRLRAAWQEANRLKALGAGMDPGTLPAREDNRFLPLFGRRAHVPSNNTANLRKRVAWLSAGATAAALLLAVGAWHLILAKRTQAEYSTPIGGVAAIPLSDGSQVTLNTNSQMQVSVNDAERRVSLLQGEAFFEVKPDPVRPFIVLAGTHRIVVLGTQFSVRRDRDDVEVLVTEGRVRIEGSQKQSAVPLEAGAVARSHGTAMAIEQRTAPEAQQALTWRSGFLTFKDIPLADAVAEFNRYTPRQIVIEDPSIAAIKIGGSFRTANVDAFLRILQTDFPIRVSDAEDRVILARADR